MWRVRSVMRLLLVYFLWLAVFSHSQTIFGYEKPVMLTYVLGTSILQALVLSSRSIDVGGEISSGDLSNYLLKPLNYFRYWFARDTADKLLNVVFVLIELGLFIVILKPALVGPDSWQAFFGAIVAAALSMLLYFYLSFLISMTTFWYAENNGWPARFLFQTVMDFVAGGLFPLDILPASLYAVFRFLPTSYLLFFPVQVWLGRVNLPQIWWGLGLMVFWIWLLRYLTQKVWQRGVKTYEAFGR